MAAANAASSRRSDLHVTGGQGKATLFRMLGNRLARCNDCRMRFLAIGQRPTDRTKVFQQAYTFASGSDFPSVPDLIRATVYRRRSH